MTNTNDNIQYNSCISKGICSVSPKTLALQNVLRLYLSLCAKYCLKLQEKNLLDLAVKEFILNTVVIAVSNHEIAEIVFWESVTKLKEILPELIQTYNKAYNESDFKGEYIFNSDLFKKCENVVETIKFGEYIYKNAIIKLSPKIIDYFKILLIVAKSISLNLLDLKNYLNDLSNWNKHFAILLEIFNSLTSKNNNVNHLKSLINKGAKSNTELMLQLRQEQEKSYGKQKIVKISYTTTPSKAVLAVGSDIQELENILIALKDTDIDIYTHGEMMVAHTFPKLNEYKSLRGQYGYGLENCLIDFATFPGPIILTKHSMHNVENFYRGRLFTTDINSYQGVIKIENGDYSKVIQSANQAKGFKKGKVCKTATIGYDYENSLKLIDEKLSAHSYKKIVIIGLKNYSSMQNEYFENLIKYLSDEILIISFSYNAKRNNFLYFNTGFDSFSVVKIALYLLNFDLPLEIFLPKCGRNTLAEMIYFAQFPKNKIYMGECEPIAINPSLRSTLYDIFGIETIKSAKKDAESVNKLS